MSQNYTANDLLSIILNAKPNEMLKLQKQMKEAAKGQQSAPKPVQQPKPANSRSHADENGIIEILVNDARVRLHKGMFTNGICLFQVSTLNNKRFSCNADAEGRGRVQAAEFGAKIGDTVRFTPARQGAYFVEVIESENDPFADPFEAAFSTPVKPAHNVVPTVHVPVPPKPKAEPVKGQAFAQKMSNGRKAEIARLEAFVSRPSCSREEFNPNYPEGDIRGWMTKVERRAYNRAVYALQRLVKIDEGVDKGQQGKDVVALSVGKQQVAKPAAPAKREVKVVKKHTTLPQSQELNPQPNFKSLADVIASARTRVRENGIVS